MPPYINPAKLAPGVQAGHASRISSSHRQKDFDGRELKIFSVTRRPTAYIFSI